MAVKSVAVSVANLVVVAAGGVEGFNINLKSDREKKNLQTQRIILCLYLFFDLQCPQNNGIALPPHVLLVAPPLYCPLRRGHLFFVGCCVYSSYGGHLRPCRIFIFISRSVCRPKLLDGVPPRAPPPHPLCHNIPPTTSADSALIVVSCHLTAAT